MQSHALTLKFPVGKLQPIDPSTWWWRLRPPFEPGMLPVVEVRALAGTPRRFVARAWDGISGRPLWVVRGRRMQLPSFMERVLAAAAACPDIRVSIDLHRVDDISGGGEGATSPPGDPNPKGIIAPDRVDRGATFSYRPWLTNGTEDRVILTFIHLRIVAIDGPAEVLALEVPAAGSLGDHVEVRDSDNVPLTAGDAVQEMFVNYPDLLVLERGASLAFDLMARSKEAGRACIAISVRYMETYGELVTLSDVITVEAS